MNNPLRLLIDTNVWLDSYLPERVNHEKSLEMLRLATAKEAALLFGVTKLETLFYLLAHEFKSVIKREKGSVSAHDAAIAQTFAWGCIDNVREIATAVGADEADIWLACKYRTINNDLEDNMVFAAAERAQADYVVTWDDDMLKSPLAKVATPSQIVEILKL